MYALLASTAVNFVVQFWDDMQRSGIQPRRFFLYTGLAAGVALGGNLFGVTSGVLGLAPEKAGQLKLDIIYPIKGYKRCVNEGQQRYNGFEFVFPQDWLADQAIALAEQTERLKMLDPPSVAEIQRKQQRTTSLRPLAAYGPPAGTSQENVSVVKSVLAAGFSLRGTLGAPQEAAERLLSTAIAPEGSGREWQLLSARAEQRRPAGDSGEQQQEVYRFEYTIKVREVPKLCAYRLLAVRSALVAAVYECQLCFSSSECAECCAQVSKQVLATALHTVIALFVYNTALSA
eukprot:12369-Heterococcus_DN1.PRE.2